MSRTKKYKLDELGFLARGKSKHRPRNDPVLYGGDYPFFQTGDVKEAELRLRHYSQTYNDKGLAQSKLWQPGTLCITIAANIAETAILAVPGCFPDSIVGFIPDPKLADVRYVKYYLDTLKGRIQNASKGTTQDNLSLDKLLTFDFEFPEIETQRRIASILSAYDDLIENNTRRVAILEEMARRIYEEWFVKFRFPGHEKVRMVESELGAVPEGWRIRPLGALVAHSIGGGWGQEACSDEFSVQAYVIRGTDIPDVRLGSLGRAPLRFHTPSNFRSRRLQAGDIVFEVSGGSKDQPVGRSVLVGDLLLSRVDAPVICASFCRLLRANTAEIIPELLQFHFQRIYTNREILKYQTQSTGITNFKFTVFLEKEVVVQAQHPIQSQFSATVRPMLQLAELLGVRNSVLRTTRDLLLPKLISGELDVSEAPEPEALAS